MTTRSHRLNPRQLECLASPVRAELMECLVARSSATVEELAAATGRSVHSLYYHLDLLRDVGLLRERGSRASGGRRAAVFEPIAPRLRLPRGNDEAHRTSATRAVRTMLRKADREHADARHASATDPALVRHIRPLRIRTRLDERSAREFARRLAELGEWLREHGRSRGGRAYSMTALFTALAEE
ncbi:MAG: helix-turn-helix domain-containing protein [Planctomycetota bacterium]